MKKGKKMKKILKLMARKGLYAFTIFSLVFFQPGGVLFALASEEDAVVEVVEVSDENSSVEGSEKDSNDEKDNSKDEISEEVEKIEEVKADIEEVVIKEDVIVEEDVIEEESEKPEVVEEEIKEVEKTEDQDVVVDELNEVDVIKDDNEDENNSDNAELITTPKADEGRITPEVAMDEKIFLEEEKSLLEAVAEMTVSSDSLVINEIDYDQPSTDTAEFIEIKNTGDSSTNLNNYELRLINGAGSSVVYKTVDLPNVSLDAGDYYVVCSDTATVSNCDLEDISLIQNGDPDAIALYNGSVPAGVIIDTVSYGGSVPGYTEGTGAQVDLGSGTKGISRYPDGQDTNNNNADFSYICITPGSANANYFDCANPDAVSPVLSGAPAPSGILNYNNANLNISFTDNLGFNSINPLTNIKSYKVDGVSQSASSGCVTISADNLTLTYACTVGALSDGVHTLDFQVQDLSRNESLNASWTYTIDTTAPTVGAITITPSLNTGGTLYIGNLSTISAPVSDAGSGIKPTSCRYSVSNGAGSATYVSDAYDAINNQCVFPNVDTSAATGIAIAVDDNAGNWFDTSSSWVTSFVIDTDVDGILGESDNCPAIANPDQVDADGDGTGDLCESSVESCLTFEACVDGSDWVKVEGNQLSMIHGEYSAIGSHDNCASEWRDIIKVNDTSYPITLEGSQYYINGNQNLGVEVNALTSVEKIEGRGNVTQEGTSAYLDDKVSGGGAVYKIKICGEEQESVCGDDEVTGSEQCDDGNVVDGDGCSATCQNEIDSCTDEETIVDEVAPGSLSNWIVTNTGGNPIFSYNEIVSPYDSSTAIQTSVVGTTTALCPSQMIQKSYNISGNTSSTALKAYLAFTSTMDEYNFPYVIVYLYDDQDNVVGYQVYYGKGVISGIYAGYAVSDPAHYTELSASSGDMILDLSKMGADIDFSKITVYLANYACIGQNSVTFDHLRTVCGSIDDDTEPIVEGDLIGQLVSPTESLTVHQNTPFTFKSNVQCVDGNCGDVTATLDPVPSIKMLIYNPNSVGPDGSSCRGEYGRLPYQYLSDNGVEYTYWCNSNVIDASVLANYDVLYLGRSRGEGYVNSTDLRKWVQNGGGLILESNGDNNEPGTNDAIWPNIYDLFGYNSDLENMESWGDCAYSGIINKYIDHSIWDGILGAIGNGSSGLYDCDINDSHIGTGIKIGYNQSNSQNPVVNTFGLGRTYSAGSADYTTNDDSKKYFLNIINWVAGGGKGVIPMNSGEPFYTTSQNPQTKSNVSCLGDMQKDAICEQSWTVVPTGRQGSTYEFFTIYDSSLGKQVETEKVSVTIFCDDSDNDGICADAETDTTKPVITLLGDAIVSLNVGDVYVDAGATALDDIDGDITSKIVVNNPVDINTIGEYKITYNVSDKAGNNAGEVERMVKVLAKVEVSPTPTLVPTNENPDSVHDLDAEYNFEKKCVKLSWDLDDDNADEVKIYRSKKSTFSTNSSTRIGEQDSDDETFNDCDVETGEKYYYKVVVFGKNGEKSDAKKVSIKINEDSSYEMENLGVSNDSGEEGNDVNGQNEGSGGSGEKNDGTEVLGEQNENGQSDDGNNNAGNDEDKKDEKTQEVKGWFSEFGNAKWWWIIFGITILGGAIYVFRKKLPL